MKIYQDPRLSLKAKGLWYVAREIISEGNVPTIKYLWETSLQDGQGKIQRGIKELVRLGYFKREKKGGKGIQFEYILKDEVDNENIKVKVMKKDEIQEDTDTN